MWLIRATKVFKEGEWFLDNAGSVQNLEDLENLPFDMYYQDGHEAIHTACTYNARHAKEREKYPDTDKVIYYPVSHAYVYDRLHPGV